jgi:hypothetical protein
VDERVRELFINEEISIGDYVLTGGELPAMVLIDAVSRFIPGVLGSDHSAEEDSFFNFLLEYPQFTRPFDFKGSCVPEVLLSGNHSAISLWRRREALRRTSLRRPDLLAKANLSEEDKILFGEVLQGKSIDDRACLPDRQGLRIRKNKEILKRDRTKRVWEWSPTSISGWFIIRFMIRGKRWWRLPSPTSIFTILRAVPGHLE